jgi:hypothetical protein
MSAKCQDQISCSEVKSVLSIFTLEQEPLNFFAVTFAKAGALHGAAAIGHAAEGGGCLRFGDRCEPPRCRLRVSRRFVF